MDQKALHDKLVGITNTFEVTSVTSYSKYLNENELVSVQPPVVKGV